jgi:hypothetical protein
MKAATGILILLLAVVVAGCSSSSKPDDLKLTVTTLLSNLEFPKGLWLDAGKVYFTETAGRSTTYGGKVQLSVYDVGTAQTTVIKHDPVNSDAVVVSQDSDIYLCSYHGSLPGDYGEVSVISPPDTNETAVTDVTIAAEDMFMTSEDDILLIGPSDTPDATSLLRLPRGDFQHYEVVANDLLRAWCVTVANDFVFFSDQYSIQRIIPPPQGGSSTFEVFVNFGVNSLSSSSKYLFFGDYDTGTVGSFNLSTKVQRVYVSGLHEPQTVRWDQSSSKLYFVEAGTDANHYKDGTLKVIEGIK